MTDFYIFSLKHTDRKDPWITFWRPNDAGYAWPLEWSGKYTAEAVEASPSYYNDGADTMAIPAETVERLKVAAAVDGKHVFCLPNKKLIRDALIAARHTPGAVLSAAEQGEG